MGPYSTHGQTPRSSPKRNFSVEEKRSSPFFCRMTTHSEYYHVLIFSQVLYSVTPHPHYTPRGGLGQDTNPMCQERKQNAGQLGSISEPMSDPTPQPGSVFPGPTQSYFLQPSKLNSHRLPWGAGGLGRHGGRRGRGGQTPSLTWCQVFCESVH